MTKTKKKEKDVAIKPLTPEIENTINEFVSALKNPQNVGKDIECEIRYRESKEKGFDDDIEEVSRIAYLFYEGGTGEILFTITLENHSHLGKIAKIMINKKFKDQLKEMPHFSISQDYQTEYGWTNFLFERLHRK